LLLGGPMPWLGSIHLFAMRTQRSHPFIASRGCKVERKETGIAARKAPTSARAVAGKRYDQAPPPAAVMLHLRSRYVSKAAIFTTPARLCRSKIEVPLEFQGLGSLGARIVATVFPLRI